MEMTPQIMFGHVMHKRLFPKVNGFNYGIYYLLLPLSKITSLPSTWRFGINRPALAAFWAEDHGDRQGGDLQSWARNLLDAHDVSAEGEIMLLTMPRIFGHVFNPVSFWFCHDLRGKLSAVICEVNNTFGESHSYVCKAPGEEIDASNWVETEKEFHVSPFLERAGSYRFRFSVKNKNIGIWIDFYDAAQNKKLLTCLTGTCVPMETQALRRAFWRYPLVALVALVRIHWHAVKLLAKGIKYIPKPEQKSEKHSASSTHTQRKVTS